MGTRIGRMLRNTDTHGFFNQYQSVPRSIHPIRVPMVSVRVAAKVKNPPGLPSGFCESHAEIIRRGAGGAGARGFPARAAGARCFSGG